MVGTWLWCLWWLNCQKSKDVIQFGWLKLCHQSECNWSFESIRTIDNRVECPLSGEYRWLQWMSFYCVSTLRRQGCADEVSIVDCCGKADWLSLYSRWCIRVTNIHQHTLSICLCCVWAHFTARRALGVWDVVSGDGGVWTSKRIKAWCVCTGSGLVKKSARFWSPRRQTTWKWPWSTRSWIQW